MTFVPRDPFSEVVDENRRWKPDWYSWLTELSQAVGAPGGPLVLRDVDDTHDLTVVLGSDLTADHTLTLEVPDADTTLTLAGDATISGTSSGTNTGDQTITLSGDVTGTGTGSFNTTIANGAVSFAKIQDITTDKLVGRDTAANGSLEQISVSGGIEFDGTGTLQTGAFIGEVTKAAGGTDLTIADGAVTYAKRTELFKTLTADASGTNTTAVQPLFPSAGAVDVEASTTYLMEAVFSVRKTTTAANNFLSFALAGTAILTVQYMTVGGRGIGSTISDFAETNWIGIVTAAAVTNLTLANETDFMVLLKGTIRVSAAGTLIPQFKFDLTPGATVTIFAGAFFQLTPIGDDTVTEKGTWT